MGYGYNGRIRCRQHTQDIQTIRVEALASQVETLLKDKTAVLQQLADSQTLLQVAKERHAGRAAACVDAVNKAALLKEELMRIQQTLGAEIESIDATHASLYSEVCVCMCVCVCAVSYTHLTLPTIYSV